MLDINIGPTSFRPSCQLEGVHTRNKDLSLFHGCGLNNILMLSFLRSFIRNYLYLVMSQYSYACLIERSNLQNKENTMQLQFSNGSRETCGNGPNFNNTFYVQMLYRTLSSLNSLWLAEELVRTCMNVFPT